MNTRTEVQTILDARGRPAFAVVPFAKYETLMEQARVSKARERGLIPNEVVNLMFDGEGMSIARAWREHLGLTQAKVAARMRISQAALAQMEAATRPRKTTRVKLAAALGLEIAQLAVV
jgi:ribosome-binding protein aMBF1 (putative translation factor)